MRTSISALLIAAFAAAEQVSIAQQISKEDRQEQLISEMVDQGRQLATRGVIEPFGSTLPDSGQILDRLAGSWVERARYQKLEQVLEARVDKQVGASPNAAGTTSLAMKGASPKIFGFALEHGAVMEKVDGNTATIRGNPAGIAQALRGEGLLSQFDLEKHSALTRAIMPLSWAVSFDTSQSLIPGTFVPSSRQLNSWSLRYGLVNGRDVRSAHYSQLWTELARKKGQGYSAIRDELQKTLEQWPAYGQWSAHVRDVVREKVDLPWSNDHNTDAAAAKFRSILEEEFPELDDLPKPPAQVKQSIDRYVDKLTDVATAAGDIYDYALKGTLATIDWTTKRDAVLPDLYTITGVVETSLGPRRKHDLTLNSAVSFYQTGIQQTSRRFHDYSVTTQYDIPLGSIWNLPLVVSFAGRYEYIPNDAGTAGAKVSASPVAAMPKGHMGVFQAKLIIPVKGTGVRIPISITAANRTELIKEREVRANFGITFDLDAALAAALGRKH